MEEQKKKEVKMGVVGKDSEGQPQRYTYEQLSEIANNLFNENAYLKKQLQQASDTIRSINRLDFLFRVVECDHNNRNNSVSFDTAFVEKCIDEIQTIMTLPEETEDTSKEN